jgi:chemotaxis protein methyltransferase CheR
VLSQLTPEARPRLLANLARAISPEGFLFLGEGETVTGLSDHFQPVAGRPGLFARTTVRAAA